jgi:hypothetical protein
MKMSEDYLWDKSGEPDDEIIHFEKLFQEVKFDENATPMPEFRPVPNSWNRRFWMPVAIAASIGFLLLTGTLVFKRWIGSPVVSPGAVTSASPASPLTPRIATVPEQSQQEKQRPSNVIPQDKVAVITRVRSVPQNVRLVKPRRLLLESNREKGERAKAELMLALHIAGSKLNLVQQKLAVNKEAGPSS